MKPASDWANYMARLRAQNDELTEQLGRSVERLGEATITINSLRSDNEELRAALADVFALMDEQWLVRNTEHDAKPDFAVRQLEPTRRLAKAHDALAKPL